MSWEKLIELYPHIAIKIQRARERSGKKPINQADGESVQAKAKDDFEDDIPWKGTQNETVLAVRNEETPIELMKRVFDGSEEQINGSDESSGGQEGDKKEEMIDRIKGMEKTLSEGRGKYYSNPQQQGLFDDKSESVKDYKEDKG